MELASAAQADTDFATMSNNLREDSISDYAPPQECHMAVKSNPTRVRAVESTPRCHLALSQQGRAEQMPIL